jgi:hypothetical protein
MPQNIRSVTEGSRQYEKRLPKKQSGVNPYHNSDSCDFCFGIPVNRGAGAPNVPKTARMLREEPAPLSARIFTAPFPPGGRVKRATPAHTVMSGMYRSGWRNSSNDTTSRADCIPHQCTKDNVMHNFVWAKAVGRAAREVGGYPSPRLA